MTIQEWIEKAIEGGWEYTYKPDRYSIKKIKVKENRVSITTLDSDDFLGTVQYLLEEILLDPKVWEAVGTAKKWWVSNNKKITEAFVKDRMYGMIDHLIAGGTVDEYINKL